VSSWPQVREELLRLRDLEPNVLLGYSNPDADTEPNPPFTIRLTSGSLAIAEDLHGRFGAEVSLRVGALPYPPAPAGASQDPYGPMLREPVAPDHRIEGMRVALDGPLQVTSGATVEHGLLVTNEGLQPFTVNTNGQLTAQIIDPSDGTHVGGSAGAQRMPLVAFTIVPGKTTRIPLLVGTASYVPALGYTIAPGRWGLTADLDLAGRGTVRSPVLMFEVTGANTALAD
jgi:hypothetical protein